MQPTDRSPSGAPAKPLRLGVWASDGNNVHFLDPILARLPERYRVKKFTWTPNVEAEVMQRQLERVDLAWFEWGTGPILMGSRLCAGIPTVCRIHRYEVYTPAPSHVAWQNVDCLTFISKQVARTYGELHGSLPDTRVEVVPNAIPVEDFAFDAARERTFNLAFLGRLHLVKNPMLLIQILKKVVDRDPRYQLHLAGDVQHQEAAHYMMYHGERLGLLGNMHFYGRIDPSDVPSFLAKCSYILSTSVIEGHPVGVMEAMASGLKPVIHDFLGARDIFAPEHLFNTVDEAAELILEEAFDPAAYRGFIAEHYDQAQQVERYVALLDDLARRYYPERVDGLAA